MPDEFQFDVFLSHSSKDKAAVRPLAERLRAAGLAVWFDEWEIKPGDSIPAKIEEGLEHSRVLVLCMSANAFGSDWAQLESHTFRFRDPMNKERRFIPLRLDDAPIKGSLAQFRYVLWLDQDREREYPKLLEACRKGAIRAGSDRPEANIGWHVPSPKDVVVDRSSRDDFTRRTKDTLARRVGMRCSNPDCRKLTSGPQTDPNNAINIGVAAHITAAAVDGPRYDRSLSKHDRSSIENAIWLCQNCAKLVDSDVARFSVAILRAWKQREEENARRSVETNGAAESPRRSRKVQIIALVSLIFIVAVTLVWNSNQRRFEERVRTLERIVVQQLQQVRGPDESDPSIDLERALRDVGISSEELKGWIAQKRRSTDLSERARAEFLDKRFAPASELWEQAANEDLRQADKANQERERRMASAVDNLTRSGEALRAADRLEGALGLFTKALGYVSRDEHPPVWAYLQNWSGICHMELGTRVEGQAARQHLVSSIPAYQSALTIFTRQQFPEEWAMAQNNLGNALAELGSQTPGPDGLRLLSNSVTAIRLSLEVMTRERFPIQWARNQNNLSHALYVLAESSQRGNVDNWLREAIAAIEITFDVFSRQEFPECWAENHNKLGDAFGALARLRQGPEAEKLWEQSVAAYGLALEVLTFKQFPRQWAKIQNNLAVTLREWAEQSTPTKARTLLEEGVRACKRALEVTARESFPQRWAQLKINLAIALDQQATLTNGTEQASLFEQSLRAHREALQVYTRTEFPVRWGQSQRIIGTLLIAQGQLLPPELAESLFEEANVTVRGAMEILTKEDFPQDWATLQNNLGTALVYLVNSRPNEATRLLSDALVAYRAALEVWTASEFPEKHSMVQGNLGRAEEYLRKRISGLP